MNSVMKGAGYILVHTPDMVLHNGTTQTTERIVNPDSEYLKQIKAHLRPYSRVRAYYPNQTYIGNVTPFELAEVQGPWQDLECPVDERYGSFGEIMPQDEFYLLINAVDEFELVYMDKGFVNKTKSKLEKDPIIGSFILDRIPEGVEQSKLRHMVDNEGADGLYMGDEIVGAVRRAHDIDVNLSAHVMLENLVSKASSALALLYAVKNAGISPDEVEYTIDCSEEACGDMNQRGGGNFAKATAEIAELSRSTGSDVRGFCAAPAHAVMIAASLVKAGTFKAVAVTAGGSTAKLGMNGKDHVKKGLPILEDCLGGFAVIISENDGINPEINVENVGWHAVGTGSAPQNVIASLVTDPLERAGLKVTDVDYYSPEMQNPDITKPAGAGDVPLSNMKMIGALAVKRGDIERKDLGAFVEKHGLPGFAPTQGHIPSGVPLMGHTRDAMLKGDINRVMIVGKGSLFLGRMTNLFDGVSFLMERNLGVDDKASSVSTDEIRQIIAESLRDFAAGLLESR
ncbi:MAG: glycine reductase [Clostridiaceae bacterium]|nr:glycine reductase [Clostridiaceae bacterium]